MEKIIYRNRILLIGLMLFFSQFSYAQLIEVTGKVTDTDNMPLPGVNITIKGSTTGVITNIDGEYSIQATKGKILTYSYIGFSSKEIEISDQTTINITLEMDIKALEEVVIIGYGTAKKSDLTGSIGVVSADDYKLQNITRVENMLQNKAAGVTVSQNSGAPGSSAKVRIRGISTTGGPIYVIDGQIGANINTINPDDIESISILKDASAAAIYGSRGANGVILVKTKTAGKSDVLKANLTYKHSISSLAKKLDLLGPANYMRIINEKDKEEGRTGDPEFSRDEIAYIESNNIGTDWQDAIFSIAHSDEMQFSVSKGGKKSALRFSTGARNDDGILNNTNYKRLNARITARVDLTNSTKFSINMQNSLEMLHNTAKNRTSAENDVVKSALAWSPNLPVYDSLGDYTIKQGYGPNTFINPVYLAEERNADGANKIFSGNIRLEQKFLKFFNLGLYGAANYSNNVNQKFDRYAPYNKEASSTPSNPSSVSYGFSRNYSLQSSAQITYNRDFSNKTRLNVTSVVETQYSRNRSYGFSAKNFVNDLLEQYSANAAEDYPSGHANIVPDGMFSYLGRVEYDFRKKILYTGSARYDKSSRLPPEHQGEWFFSSGLAYRISEEKFMQSIHWLNNLKFRLSFGETGNISSINEYMYQDIVKGFGGYLLNGKDRSRAYGFEDGGNRTNPDLKWETSRQFNAGIDAAFIDGMFSFSTDYFIKYIYDALFQRDIPDYLGGGSQLTNLGIFRTNGIEFETTVKWLQKTDMHWFFNTSFNLTYNTSKVIEIGADQKPTGGKPSGFEQNSHILLTGDKIGYMWGYKYLGIDSEGEAVYEDLDNNNILNGKDMQIIGNGHPDVTWGLNINTGYKDFSLFVSVQGLHGADINNMTRYMLLGGGAGVLDGTSTELLQSYSFNPNSYMPKLSATYRPQSSIFVEDGSFVRISDLTLAYDLPQKAIPNTNLQLYASVSNLYTFTTYSGYDPSTHSGGDFAPGIDKGSFPLARTVTFGFKINW